MNTRQSVKVNKKTKGVIEIYYNFIDFLRIEKKKVAMLQLTGRIEDFLVKEFCYFVFNKTDNKLFPITNLGLRGEQKIDISLLKNVSNETKVVAMIEAKYFRNVHKIWGSNAMDEIETTLKDLARQLHDHSPTTHGNYKVVLQSNTSLIYGLVFASFVSLISNDRDQKQSFHKKLIIKANKYFKYHDLDKPYLRPVYDDVPVNVLGKQYYVSLQIALWKRKVARHL